MDELEASLATNVDTAEAAALEELRLRDHFGFSPGWTTVVTEINSLAELQGWMDSDADVVDHSCLECKAAAPWFLHGPGGVRDEWQTTHNTLLSYLRFKYPQAYPIDGHRPGLFAGQVRAVRPAVVLALVPAGVSPAIASYCNDEAATCVLHWCRLVVDSA